MKWHRLVLVLGYLVVLPAAAGAFPERPITMVVGFAPGGGSGMAAAILADRIAANLGPEARVVVEHRPGAGGVTATQWLREQPADGHTVMLAELGAVAVAPAFGSATYDPIAHFTFIGLVSISTTVLVVSDRFPGQTAAEAIAYLRSAPPGSLTYATPGPASAQHLRALVLAHALGTRFTHSPQLGGGPAMQAVRTGQAQFGFASMSAALPAIRTGGVRAVAVVGAHQTLELPDVPTLQELGVQGLEDGGFYLLMAPAGVPAPRTEALNRALNVALVEAQTRQRLNEAGHPEPPAPNSAAATRAYVERRVVHFRTIVERSGARLQN